MIFIKDLIICWTVEEGYLDIVVDYIWGAKSQSSCKKGWIVERISELSLSLIPLDKS